MDKFEWDLLHVSMTMIRMRQKMFGNSGGFGFNVSFVDKASMFVESVFETSLSFAYACIVKSSGYTVSCKLNFWCYRSQRCRGLRPEYKSDKCEVSGRYFVVGWQHILTRLLHKTM